ncbi:YccF domain-containing protein [Saccharicrinis aurantiacus]|uniref:YccF domain-containing protein n=1 Tax=Saccharicrinis aurantiacus TaxID=1849719 RepID=UPI00094FDD24|nr:YccF domain-containing protein [Saccharicrinis aurantiacus]
MRTLGNVIWFVFGGIFISIGYILASIPLFVSIIGIPFGIQTLKLAGVALWPFGKRITESAGNSGCLSLFMNILWLITGGFGICLSHLLMGLLFSITIIGIPFGKQHFKLAGLALTPFGRIISEK